MSALSENWPHVDFDTTALAWQDGSPRAANTSRRQRPRVTAVASRWGRLVLDPHTAEAMTLGQYITDVAAAATPRSHCSGRCWHRSISWPRSCSTMRPHSDGRLGAVRIFLSRKSCRDRAEVLGLNGAPAPRAPCLPVAAAPRQRGQSGSLDAGSVGPRRPAGHAPRCRECGQADSAKCFCG